MNQAETTMMNWGGNYEYKAANIMYPASVEEIQDIVRNSQRVKALGSRHSFNAVADTSQNLISLKNLDRLVEVSEESKTVTIEAGMTYGQLCPILDQYGFALPNLASLPHITVVGSCMTGTHGSGVNNGNLATSIVGLEFVAADGTLHQINDNDENFSGFVVGLGAFGIITKITLKVMPSFDMWQKVFLDLPLSTLETHFDDVMGMGYSVSLFTKWEKDSIGQVWVKEQATNPVVESLFDATPAQQKIHPIIEADPEACTDQLGQIGKWSNRLPHFRLDFQPSFGREIQSEYFVAREDAFAALEAIRAIQSHISPLLYTSEVRSIAADSLWMSPCYDRASVAIHFTWKPEQDKVLDILPKIENQLKPFNARPHWGKVFTLSADYIQSQYERLNDFATLVQQHDPDKKFSNPFLSRYIFGDEE